MNMFSPFYRYTNKAVVVLLSLLLVVESNAQDKKELRDSLEIASKELSLQPSNIDLRLRKASWNMQLEQWEYAKTEYDYVLSREPNNLTALFFRAFANEKLNRYRFSRLDYENLLAIAPAHFEARLGLALLNQKDKHYTEAFDQMNLLIQQHPDSAIAYAVLAGIEQERELYEPAIYDYGEAIKRDPNNTDYLLNRADLYLKLRRFIEAENDLKRLESLGIPRQSLQALYKRMKKTKNKH